MQLKQIFWLLVILGQMLYAQETPDSVRKKSKYEQFEQQRTEQMRRYADKQAYDLDSLRAMFMKYEAEREDLMEQFLNNEKDDNLVERSQAAEKKNPIVEVPTEESPAKVDAPKPREVPADTRQDELLVSEIEANRPVFYPVDAKYPITSPFDLNRFHPVLRTNKPHKGIDFGAPQGTPVYATAGGLVEIARFSKSAGNWVMINHHNGYKTVYMHLGNLAKKEKARIKRGDVIGYVGSTGYSTGPHLHYEVRLDNRPLNPKRFLMYK